MRVGDTILQLAGNAAAQHALGQGWQVRRVMVGPEVTILTSGDCAVAVHVITQDGGEYAFEYRCDVTGAGSLCAIDC